MKTRTILFLAATTLVAALLATACSDEDDSISQPVRRLTRMIDITREDFMTASNVGVDTLSTLPKDASGRGRTTTTDTFRFVWEGAHVAEIHLRGNRESRMDGADTVSSSVHYTATYILHYDTLDRLTDYLYSWSRSDLPMGGGEYSVTVPQLNDSNQVDGNNCQYAYQDGNMVECLTETPWPVLSMLPFITDPLLQTNKYTYAFDQHTNPLAGIPVLWHPVRLELVDAPDIVRRYSKNNCTEAACEGYRVTFNYRYDGDYPVQRLCSKTLWDDFRLEATRTYEYEE